MTLDWISLLKKDRCKAFGVPWNDEERSALYELKIPAEYVRRGFVTVAEYEKEKSKDEAKVKETGKVPLSSLRKEKLLALVHGRGLTATDEATKDVLIALLVQDGCPKSVPAEA